MEKVSQPRGQIAKYSAETARAISTLFANYAMNINEKFHSEYFIMETEQRKS